MFIKLLIGLLKAIGGVAQAFFFLVVLTFYFLSALFVWAVAFHPKPKPEDNFELSRIAVFPIIKK